MNRKIIYWKKEGTTVGQHVYACDCGETMRLIGSAGCDHDDDHTYFYQCRKCKDVQSASEHLPYHSDLSFLEAGWKKVDEV